MVQNFHLPPTGFGPGSQPESDDGAELQFMALPSGMRTYSLSVPEMNPGSALRPALDLLAEMARACARVASGAGPERFDLSPLCPENRALIAETMGEGEVSMRLSGQPELAVQESVFAGVWQIAGPKTDLIEIAPVPGEAGHRAFVLRRAPVTDLPRPENGIINAPALIFELQEKSAGFAPGQPPHVINLTLLPHSEEDLAALDRAVGLGAVTILSRGYGNCRVTATGLPHVWRVQFYNSMDVLILDTFEIGPMPEVVIAASEDLSESSERLGEVLEALT